MPKLRTALFSILSVLSILLMPATAQAATHDPLGFHFLSPVMTVHENEGQALITVARTDVTKQAWVRYIAVGPAHPCGASNCTAQYRWDFTRVQGTLSFPPLVATQTFAVPIVDHHADTIPQTVQVALYGPWPLGMASPHEATLTILNDDPPPALEPVDPSAQAASAGNPLAGDEFFVDHEAPLAVAGARHAALRVAGQQPNVERFGNFSGNDVGMAVAHYLARTQVEEPGTVPMLSTYRLVDGHCGHWSDPPTDQLSYHNFIDRFAQGVGSYRAVLFLEMDSIITTGCLTQTGLAVREHELSSAIDALHIHCPNLTIYVDAGAADALPPAIAAIRLRRAGIAKIQGFFLNSTHFDWTSREISYGERISARTGGKHFVISTSENGRGPLVPRSRVRQGNEVLCNPMGRGLGPRPTANTGYPNLDAFAWILHPGESTGRCGAGAPPTGQFWLGYALMLGRNAVFSVR